jgi:hypothetical protein
MLHFVMLLLKHGVCRKSMVEKAVRPCFYG